MSEELSQTNPVESASTESSGPSPAVIDASCRWPLILLFAKGVGWLVLGTFLLLLASIKLHGPGMFADAAWLGLGRLKPAAMTALVYGFATQVAFGVLLWMLCRLGRTVLLNASLLSAAAVVWNLGVFLGLVGILGGATTGFAYLEMPRVAWPFLFVSLGVIALWALLLFHVRRDRALYVSQWFLVVALLWLPWILTVGVGLLVFQPVRGVMQAIVNAWFAHNLFHLWLMPVGMAVLFYFVPKLTSRPLYSRQLALFAFWTLACFAPWGGMARFGGGPLPNWMISVSVAANVLMLVPALAVAANLLLTVEKAWKERARRNPVECFMACGWVALVVGVVFEALISLRTVAEITLFTFIPMAVDHLLLLGFFGMTVIGAIYHILPRVTGLAWPSEKLSRIHLGSTALGLGLYLAALVLGGLIQGARLNNPEVEFMRGLRSSLPFVGLSTLGLLIVLGGQLVFCLQVQRMVWQAMAPTCRALCSLCCGGRESGKAEVKS